MKKNIILLVTFFCSLTYAQKKATAIFDNQDFYQVINEYLKLQVKDKANEIIVIKEKLNPNVTLQIFQGQFPRSENDKLDYNELYGGAKRPLFNDRAFTIMKNKYHDDKKYAISNITDEQWNKTDLDLDKIKFISFVRFVANSNKGDDSEINNLRNNTLVIGLSQPIIYDKKYLIFQFNITTTPFFGFSNAKVVVMQKVKNKWAVVDEISNYELN